MTDSAFGSQTIDKRGFTLRIAVAASQPYQMPEKYETTALSSKYLRFEKDFENHSQ